MPGEGQLTDVRDWWTVREVAEYLRLSRAKVYDLIKTGVLVGCCPPGCRRVLVGRVELDKYIRSGLGRYGHE